MEKKIQATDSQENYRKNVEKYQELVEELMRDQPDESRVRKLMLGLKLEYKKEPIERLNSVLLALHQ
ncbi:MAG: hypothetical protein CL677_00115 [Bdellovibrionaceae bacterium]|nr:hypothetical protein [Pseudobdellovibrionaceae bacterium]|tara:strand:- start:107774 stop:107974 length:201 start_codon:yes stop_codon:yes gene_type:complete